MTDMAPSNSRESHDAATTSEIIGFRTVTFEETGETRDVLRDCKVCFNHAEVYGQGVVSPSGVAHITEYEETLCGKDATGDRWWWPL